MGDWIKDGFDYVLYNIIYRLFYWLEILLCLIVNWLQKFFNVFTGLDQVKYKGDDYFLIDVFFGNKVITSIYWGMAAIGVVLTFVFSIMAVTKKAADIDDKMRQSHGQILRSMLRSIFVIVSMNLVITIVIAATNVLMVSVDEVFNNAPLYTEGNGSIVYTDEQFAAMGRVYNTIGNYSLNASYNNRYNLNTCYNEIRADLKYLGDTGVFNYSYNETDSNGKQVDSWQSLLLEVALAADYNKELDVDVYNESVANALVHCMTVLKTNYNFKALEDHKGQTGGYVEDSVPLDRIIFLIGTMGTGNNAAAKSDAYNTDPSLYDNLRRPYYVGEKDIYDFSQVNKDFDISFTRTNYVVVYFVTCAIIANMALIIVNCIVRIFNLLFVYLIAPPIIAASPLDDGAKFKQWTTAFIVQAFSVFATVISMRIFLVYVPIVMNPNFELLDNSLFNMIGKLIMVWAGIKAVEKANGILTGILADNAGWQSVMAGDMSGTVRGSRVGRMAASLKQSFENKVGNAVTGTAVGTAKTAARIGTLPARPLIGMAKSAGNKLKELNKNYGLSAMEKGLENAPKKLFGSQQAPKGFAPSRPAADIKGPQVPGAPNNGIAPDRPAADLKAPNIPEAPKNAVAPDRPAADLKAPNIPEARNNAVAPDRPAADLKAPQIPGAPRNNNRVPPPPRNDH